MKRISIIILLALSVCASYGQTGASFDSLTARYRLRLNGRDLREIVTSINSASTHFQSPTAKAIYTAITNLDSLNLKEGSVNLKDLERAGATAADIMTWNGTRWVAKNPNFGDVWKDSITIRTKPQYEPSKNATQAASTIEWDADTTSNLYVSLSSNLALFAPENIRPGGRYTITIKQDAVGGWGLSLPQNILLDDNASINSAALSTSVLDCSCDGSNLYCAVSRYGQGVGYELLTTYYDSLDLWFVPSEFGNSFRFGTAFNTITAFGQSLTQYTDPSMNAHIIDAVTASESPTVQLVLGKICAQFDGSNDYYTIVGSRAYTKAQTSNFTIGVWFLAGQDGVKDFIFSSTADGAGTGIACVAPNKSKALLSCRPSTMPHWSSLIRLCVDLILHSRCG